MKWKVTTLLYFFFQDKADTVPKTPTTPIKKEGNQWYDVGIIKGTSCVVSHFYLSTDALQAGGNGNVIDFFLLSIFFRVYNLKCFDF